METLKNIYLNMFLLVITVLVVGITISYFYAPVAEGAHTYVTSNPSLVATKLVVNEPFKLLGTIFFFNSTVAGAMILMSYCKKITKYVKYIIYIELGYQLAMISLLIGYVAHFLSPQMICASLLPHGLVEIPIIMLAAAYGVYLCETNENAIRVIRNYIFWILIPLFIAAVLEVFLTPLVMSYV